MDSMAKVLINQNQKEDETSKMVGILGELVKGHCGMRDKVQQVVEKLNKTEIPQEPCRICNYSGRQGHATNCPNIECWYCKEKGHMTDTCPKLLKKNAGSESDP